MIGRRGFLRAIGAGVLGLSLALRRPEPRQVFRVVDPESGISIRFVQHYDIDVDTHPMRFDLLIGQPRWAVVRPDFAVRIGNA